MLILKLFEKILRVGYKVEVKVGVSEAFYTVCGKNNIVYISVNIFQKHNKKLEKIKSKEKHGI